MTNIIATDAQKQSVDSPKIELFELELPDGEFAFFHAGLDSNLDEIHFRNRINPSVVNEYTAIPLEMSPVDVQADGALSRPTLTVANVTSVFEDELGYTIDSMVGQRLVKRETLEKYLDDGTGNSSNPPVEFRSTTFVIDRISGRNKVAIVFELSMIHDLQGVQVPKRQSRGTYCSWMYQGHAFHDVGGCVWPGNSKFLYQADNAVGAARSTNLFFDVKDSPLVKQTWFNANKTTWAADQSYTPASYVVKAGTGVSDPDKYYVAKYNHTSSAANAPGTGAGFWKEVRLYVPYVSSAGVSWTAGDLVRHKVVINNQSLDTVWKCTRSHDSTTSGTTPSLTSAYWKREELCGKKLSSCKCRFQALVVNPSSDNSHPRGDKSTQMYLPFGSYMGLKAY